MVIRMISKPCKNKKLFVVYFQPSLPLLAADLDVLDVGAITIVAVEDVEGVAVKHTVPCLTKKSLENSTFVSMDYTIDN